ncbi:MAG: methylmalonyl Co-A mutase-associated GTPase MeaB [Bacteroidales bacterium]|nr:methylmalonyl Co-A mutase-associated GTPase MeaB [Bacteroidales bacterium]
MPGPRKFKSALKVMDGIEQPGQVNKEALKKLKAGKRPPHNVQELVDGILAGNRTLLSKAITLVESSLPEHMELGQEVIAGCLRETRAQLQNANGKLQTANGKLPTADYRLPTAKSGENSIRVGITGVPGVGKSTFIEALGKYITSQGYRLAVLAIDPSSARSKGSILGDKTRMEELAVDPNAFIRPSPAAGSLGGVARKTRETIILCEAAGFDVIFVETVGVGQSETAVHSMVDFFLLLMLAGAGDELQGIKRGIIEMADVIMINKADGDNIGKAQAACMEYANALQLFPPADSGWLPVADICSARSKLGIDCIWELILEHRKTTLSNGYFYHQRMEQNRQVFRDAIDAGLHHHFFAQKGISEVIAGMEEEIREGRMNPYRAAQEVLGRYLGGLVD